jgi:hypothetical protein
VAIGQQISFWWCVFRQNASKIKNYSSSLFTINRLIDDSFFDSLCFMNYSQEFNLLFNQAFGEFPASSMKYYCRYQRGICVYHSLCYKRRNNRGSFNVCVQQRTRAGGYQQSWGQILFFFYYDSVPYFCFKKHSLLGTAFSSLLEPIEDIPNWKFFMDRYYSLVHHSSSQLLILPCSSIVSKCIFFQLDDNLSLCTPIELETEHD